MAISSWSRFFVTTGCFLLFSLNGFIIQEAYSAPVKIWVSPDGNDETGSGSEALPYQTINFAINRVAYQDTLILKSGNYSENVVIRHKSDFIIRSADESDLAHIQAPAEGAAVYIDQTDSIATRGMIIENIIISHDADVNGPGLEILNSSLTIRNSIIQNNSTAANGGGIKILNSNKKPLIFNNHFEYNSANSGAGIFCENSAVEIRSNTFNNNFSSGNGGAVAFLNCFDINFSQNTVSKNRALNGGAVYIESNSTLQLLANQFKNNQIFGNEASLDGGAIYAFGGNVQILPTAFEQNTLAENKAGGNGGAIFLINTTSSIFRQNVIVKNEANINGGGLALYNMNQKQILLWSNTITGNRADSTGGGIFLENINNFTAGQAGDPGLANNIFNNKDSNRLNNIYSASFVSTLSLSLNYWGSSNQNSISQQLDISDLNESWKTYEISPADVRIKLFKPRQFVWFADGKIEFLSGEGLSPVGDSTLIVKTHPDTSFSVSGIGSVLPKIYSFDWNGVALGGADGALIFNLTNADLNFLGNPPIDDLYILGKSDAAWFEKSSTPATQGSSLTTPLDNLLTTYYTIGSNLKALDTVLSVIPKPNSADYNKFEPIEISFKNDMNPTSINNENIKIHGSNSGNRNFSIDFDSAFDILNLQINDGLQAGETVTVTLTDSIKRVSGENLPGNSWQFMASALRGSGDFQPANPIQQSPGAIQYLFNDFNRDLVPELIKLSYDSLIVYRKQNGAEYAIENYYILSRFFNQMRMADLNNDGINEIVLFDDAGFQAYEYNSAVGFTESFNDLFTAGGFLNDVQIADYNNDGIQDMAFLIDTGDFRLFECYYGLLNQDYSFGIPTSFFLNGQADKLALLDWDRNGLYDLIASNGSTESNIALISNENTAFSAVINPVTEILSQNIVKTGNVWESFLFPDQKEIIIAGSTDSNFDVLKLYNVDNNGNLVETYRKQFDNNLSISDVLVADYNSDGFNDLAVGFYNGSISLLLSNNLGHLESEKPISLTQIIPHSMLATDFESDGDLDLFITEFQDGALAWSIMENISRNPRSWFVDQLASFGDGSILNPFTKINDAINRSFEDDSVFVSAGAYNENLKIRHSLFLSSRDTQTVILNPKINDPFSRSTVDIADTRWVSIQNFLILNHDEQGASVGLWIENNDSLVLRGVRISNFDQGIFSDNSHLWLQETDIHENGLANSHNSMGIYLGPGSEMNISQSSVSRNGAANIMMNNAALNAQFTFIGETAEDNSIGSGIIAENGSVLNLHNSVLFNNAVNGIELDNSNATVLNSIFAYNDSLFQNSGSALTMIRGSVADVKNSIFISNNTAIISSGGSTLNSNYNDFFANNSGNNAGPGTGNLAVNPLMVFMYNPTGPLQELDGFDNAKLAVGSPLIDKGDPSLTNGNSSSRSDIGLYGNLGRPFALETLPQPFLKNRDSLITISWQNVEPAEEVLFAGTAIFRDTVSGFEPDTLNLLKYILKEENSFDDRTIDFGKEYYYRLAFVDTNGAAYAYTDPVQGRIDFKEISVESPNLLVQLAIGDRLIVPVDIINSGTLPVNVTFANQLPWLTILPQTLSIQRGEKGQVLFSFNTNGLTDNGDYSAKVEFTDIDDPLARVTLNVRMIVSVVDILPPKTKLFTSYPDTVKQANLSFLFVGDDSMYSTVGTPKELIRYAYRFTDLSGFVGPQEGITSQQRLDFFPLADGRYRFEVAALDTNGNGGLNINSQVVDVTLKASVLDVAALYWQMVTVPRNIVDSSVQINTNAIGSLRHWQNGIYEHIAADSLQAGFGYWIITAQKFKVDLNKYPIVPPDTNYIVKLDKGWNMIGNPWSWNISWENLILIKNTGSQIPFNDALDTEIDAGIYSWNASLINQGYKSRTDLMKTNTGYWIKAAQAMSLSFNPTPALAVSESLKKPATLTKIPLQDAMVQLKIKQGSSTDYENYYGVCNDKKEYPHFYRKAAEAPSIAGTRLYSNVNGQSLAANLVLFSEIDSVYTWEILVENSDDGKEKAQLSWQNLNNESTVKFYLYHLESGSWFNLAEEKFFVIENSKQQNHFKLYATENADFKPAILPVKFSLSQNYPNPFNPVTTIKLSIPYFANGIKARVDVFDVLGRKVKNLLNHKVQSGTVELSWNGLNERGNQAASGIYFYKLTAGDFTKSKKMILIR